MDLQPPAFLAARLKQLPDLLLKPVSYVPYGVQGLALELALNDLFKQHLQDGELDFLSGRYLAVQVSNLNLGWVVTLIRGRLAVVDNRQVPDVIIRAHARDLLLLASRREDPDTLFFQRRLIIEGDTELGLTVKNILDSLEWDALPGPMRFMLQRSADYAERFG